MESISVFLADDHQVVMESLAMMISSLDGIKVVGTAMNGRKALEQIESMDVDIVLSDMHMPELNGVELALQLREQRPDVKLILLTIEEEPELVQAAIEAGVCGYVLKKATKKELETAIHIVADGEKYYVDLFGQQIPEIPVSTEILSKELLSKREIEIIRLIVNDIPGLEIAEKLFISPNTVETHRRNIFRKLDIHSVVALTRFAMKHNLL